MRPRAHSFADRALRACRRHCARVRGTRGTRREQTDAPRTQQEVALPREVGNVVGVLLERVRRLHGARVPHLDVAFVVARAQQVALIDEQRVDRRRVRLGLAPLDLARVEVDLCQRLVTRHCEELCAEVREVRESERGTERQRETQRGRERHRETQRGTERHREAVRLPSMLKSTARTLFSCALRVKSSLLPVTAYL